MKIFKNEVGRPSNETIRKRNIIKVSIFLVVILLVTALTVLISNTLTKVKPNNNVVNNSGISGFQHEEDDIDPELKELVNADKVSDEFYEKYEEDYKTLRSMNNLENVLIVKSKNKLDDNYGATFVVEAPNHDYYLQYNTEEERKTAFSKQPRNWRQPAQLLTAAMRIICFARHLIHGIRAFIPTVRLPTALRLRQDPTGCGQAIGMTTICRAMTG